MTVRENILNNLYNGLQNITSSNGYDNTVVEVRKGLVDSSTINSFPVLSVQLGSEVIQTQIEGNTEGLFSLDVFIIGFVNSNDITTDVESMIRDIKRYLYKDVTISENYVCNLFDIDFIQGYEIKEINPYLAYKNNICSFGVLLKVEYIDFIEPVNITSLDAPVLSSPSNGYGSGSLFQSLNWDPVDDAQYYHIRIYNNGGVLTIDQDNLVNTSFTIPADISFNDGDIITWKVRAKAGNTFSEWSYTWNFTINDTSITPLNPSEISNNNLWLRSDLGVTQTSGRVSTWADQSTGGSNLTQSTSTRRPIVSVNAYGSKPSIYFNPDWSGSGETLSYNDSSAKYSFTSANQVSFMITFLTDGTKLLVSDTYFSPFTRSNTNYGSQFSFTRGVNTGPGSYQLGYPYPAGDYLVVPLALNIPHQIIVVKNTTNHKVYLDGNKIGDITKTPTSFAVEANSYLNVGSTYNTGDGNGKFTGHFFEVAFWTKLLSASEIASLYKYHKDYFNI